MVACMAFFYCLSSRIERNVDVHRCVKREKVCCSSVYSPLCFVLSHFDFKSCLMNSRNIGVLQVSCTGKRGNLKQSRLMRFKKQETLVKRDSQVRRQQVISCWPTFYSSPYC
jgi:hypothetical protein